MNATTFLVGLGGFDRVARFCERSLSGSPAVPQPRQRRTVDTGITVEQKPMPARVDQSTVVVLAVQRQPGTNTIEIVDAINKILPTFESQLPPSIKLSTLYDRSQSIRESVRDVQLTLLLALSLVVAVIFVFLRSASATFVTAIRSAASAPGTCSRARSVNVPAGPRYE